MAQTIAAHGSLGGILDPKQQGHEENAYREMRTPEVEKLVETLLKTLDPSTLDVKTSNAEEPAGEAKKAVEAILQCPEKSYAQILDISEGATKADATAAWRRRGCLVQPHMKNKTAGQAFCRLIDAAKELGVDLLDIDEVLFWDGKEDLDKLDDGEGEQATEDEVSEPPSRVVKIYKDATPHLRELALDPRNKTTLEKINQLNYVIIEENRAQGLKRGGIYRWTIPTSFFGPQYSDAVTRLDILKSDPTNATAKDEIAKIKFLIDEAIRKNHYPTAWTIPSVEDFLKVRSSKKQENAESDDESDDEEDEKTKPTENAKQAIDWILKTKKNDFWGILGVDSGSQQEEKTINAFRKLGCALHPIYVDGSDTEQAFNKLMRLAKKANINSVNINEVKMWDGKDDLIGDEDSMFVDESTPAPPEHVLDMYKEATEAVHALQLDVGNQEAVKFVKHDINAKIVQQNKEANLPADQWQIDIDALVSNYTFASKYYEDMIKNPEESEPAENLQKLKKVLDALAAKYHYPASWSLPDDFVETAKTKAIMDKAEKAKAAQIEAKAATKIPTGTAKAGAITYPWPTLKTDDGQLILGVRRRGKIGHQVCVEVKRADGRLVRKLLPGADVGLLEVVRYKDINGYKDLAKGQSEWSSEDRPDFEELLFVTEARRASMRGNSKDPNADCCVKFRSKGIQMLSVSSLIRVLGKKSAMVKIENVCDRDGIAAPWNVEFITKDNDPTTEKRRRYAAWREANEGGESQETKKKVEGLEKQLSDVNQQLNELTLLLKNLVASSEEEL